jgi:hypothetical protein
VPPPAEYENWRANLVYQWLVYFDAFGDEIQTQLRHIPASTGFAGAGTWSNASFFGKTTTGDTDQQLLAAILAPVGMKFDGLSVRAAWDQDGNAASADAMIVRLSESAIEIVTGTTVSIADNSGVFATEQEAFTAITVESGWDYYVMAQVDGGDSVGSPSFTVQWWELTPTV